ncbi:MAG: lasso RiPP family leader peptide-containing protein [Thermoanaerobaculia bacterium]
MQPGPDRGAEKPPKRPYLPPKLERLGTIAELTRGEGVNNQFDGSIPPGQNKSII